MSRLDVLIPARNELYLLDTIQDILRNRRGDTRIIVMLDGNWPIVTIPDHPDVHLVYHPEPIGQRKAVNEAVRLSDAKYILRSDAHCSFSEGFDVGLIEPYESGELAGDVTTIPRMPTLHVFNWKCEACGHETYQGDTPKDCIKCHASGPFSRVLVWKPRLNRVTDFAYFNTEPKFQYDNTLKHRPESQGDLADVMTSVGCFFFMRRDRFWDLGGLDEEYGTYGSCGIEISCMSWLSGGRQVVNKRVYAAHAFRTQGGVWGFPYPLKEKQVLRAKARARDIWFNNKWSKQTRPLSWLIEKFAPLKSWHEPDGVATLAEVTAAGKKFATMSRKLDTQSTSPETVLVSSGQKMVSLAIDFPGVISPLAPHQIVPLGGKPEMAGVAASRIVADKVVKDEFVGIQGSDQQSPHETMDKDGRVGTVHGAHPPISIFVATPDPIPTSDHVVDDNVSQQCLEVGRREGSNRERLADSHVSSSRDDARLGAAGSQHPAVPDILPRKAILFYSDLEAPPAILGACVRQLQRAANGHEIVSVTLKPFEFGLNIVLPIPRGRIAYFTQIVEGLEAITSDIVFMAEHDCLMPPCHFAFTPPRLDRFYYDMTHWRVSADTGKAVTYDYLAVSGLCASRALLLDHYRRMLAHVQAHGFDKLCGYEPGRTPYRREGVSNTPIETWRSPVPYVDIRLDSALTASRWSTDEFHDKRTCANWQEADGPPGWGVTAGRFAAWLQEQR